MPTRAGEDLRVTDRGRSIAARWRQPTSSTRWSREPVLSFSRASSNLWCVGHAAGGRTGTGGRSAVRASWPVPITRRLSPWGQRLSQITHQADPEAGVEAGESAYYGYNAHTDVETLTDDAGNAVATYGYTAYGNADESEYTGIDRPEAGSPEGAEPYNAYR